MKFHKIFLNSSCNSVTIEQLTVASFSLLAFHQKIGAVRHLPAVNYAPFSEGFLSKAILDEEIA